MLGIFLDTETNGLNLLKHRVLDIALQMIDVETGEKLGSFHSLVSVTKEEWARSDPESLRINGFTWDEVAQGKTAESVGAAIEALFAQHKIKRGSAVFICQNPSFDRGFFSQLVNPDKQEALLWPYHWLDLASMFWTRALKEGGPYPWETGLSKDKIAARYAIAPEKSPHRAMNGVNHLILCYKAMIGFPT